MFQHSGVQKEGCSSNGCDCVFSMFKSQELLPCSCKNVVENRGNKHMKRTRHPGHKWCGLESIFGESLAIDFDIPLSREGLWSPILKPQIEEHRRKTTEGSYVPRDMLTTGLGWFWGSTVLRRCKLRQLRWGLYMH